MAIFRVLIVDEDPTARGHLRCLLSREADCELIAEYSDAREAARSLDRTQPDIMFVDIQKPDGDGFEIVRAVSRRSRLVILTSGCGDVAVRAFEAQVLDYLLKPLDEMRFRHSMGRAKNQLARDNAAEPSIRMMELLERMLQARQSPKRIAIRQNGRVVFVLLDQIDWIEAADNYACLHCANETHILRETMSDLERRLDPSKFVRLHRSAIVNIDRIRDAGRGSAATTG